MIGRQLSSTVLCIWIETKSPQHCGGSNDTASQRLQNALSCSWEVGGWLEGRTPSISFCVLSHPPPNVWQGWIVRRCVLGRSPKLAPWGAICDDVMTTDTIVMSYSFLLKSILAVLTPDQWLLRHQDNAAVHSHAHHYWRLLEDNAMLLFLIGLLYVHVFVWVCMYVCLCMHVDMYMSVVYACMHTCVHSTAYNSSEVDIAIISILPSCFPFTERKEPSLLSLWVPVHS